MISQNCFKKKAKNHAQSGDFYLDKNKVYFLDECKKSLITKCKIKSENEPRIDQILNEKSVNVDISISDLTNQQEGGFNDRQVNFQRRREFCSFSKVIVMEKQENRFTFSGNQEETNLDKENMMSLSNNLQHDFRQFMSKPQLSRRERVQQMQQKLSQIYTKGTKNFKILTNSSQSISSSLTPINPRLQLLNKLILMLQVNKNIRVGQLFQQRQVLSQQRQQEKREYLKRLQRLNEVEGKVRMRRMSEGDGVRDIELLERQYGGV